MTQTGKELIEEGKWATCWICEDIFRRRRETKRYCNQCARGYCEGEHGSFVHREGKCLVCLCKK